MNYQDYFEDWKEWSSFQDVKNYKNGVYAFRLKEPFARLKGDSNIIYIGQANHNPKKNKRHGLLHRLQNYKQNNHGGSRRLKDIIQEFGGEESIEYSYKISEKPKETEKELLDSYYEKHLELPPMNRSN